MYMSKILLDIRHPSVRQALRDVHDMHRNLMAGFEMNPHSETSRADLQVLFRQFSNRDQVYLLVTSREKPDAQELAKHGFHTREDLIRDISSLKNVFTAGRMFRFELLASPCKKIGAEGKNSRRVFLKDSGERMEWLQRKAGQCGFGIVQASEIRDGIDVRGRRGGETLTHRAVLFSGILAVAEPEAFWKGYTCGIGPGKAYGMGMLNLSGC